MKQIYYMQKVSILVPIFGVELYIERCTRSLFEQTFDNIEYIFVNDCTKDNSINILLQIIEEYPNRKNSIKILHHKTNLGLSTARNTALYASSGDYIMHVDSDDYIELNAVQLLYEKANESGADIVVCDNRYIYDNKILVTKQYIPKEKEAYLKLLLKKKAQPSIWGKLFTRDIYIRSGIKAVDGLNYGEDFAVLPRLVYNANYIIKLDKPLYNYILYNEAAYTKNISIKSINDMVWANEILETFFSAIPEKDKYRELLILSKLRTQIYFLKYSDKELWEYIVNIYQEQKVNYSLLSFSDQIILFLARRRWYILLRFVIHGGFWIKGI